MSDSESPSGRFAIAIAAWESRMSLWVETPTLWDRLTGDQLLRFEDANWSLDSAEWLSDSVVVLRLRKYPGDHDPAQLSVTVDCLTKTAEVGGTTVDRLDQLERCMERALTARRSGHQTGVGREGLWGRLRRLCGDGAKGSEVP